MVEVDISSILVIDNAQRALNLVLLAMMPQVRLFQRSSDAPSTAVA